MCNAEINLTDKNTGNVITLGSLDLNISSTLMGADVVFTNERLALNRQYRFMVNASNINGSAISTGDISKLYPHIESFQFFLKLYRLAMGLYNNVEATC